MEAYYQTYKLNIKFGHLRPDLKASLSFSVHAIKYSLN